MYSEATAVSCGVDFLYGFENEEPGADLEVITRAVSQAMWEDTYQSKGSSSASNRSTRLNAACYMFSDIKGDNGDRFGQMLMEMYPNDVITMEATNPNTGNRIVTYVWRPGKGLSKLPGWTKGKQWAKDSAHERSYW